MQWPGDKHVLQHVLQLSLACFLDGGTPGLQCCSLPGPSHWRNHWAWRPLSSKYLH